MYLHVKTKLTKLCHLLKYLYIQLPAWRAFGLFVLTSWKLNVSCTQKNVTPQSSDLRARKKVHLCKVQRATKRNFSIGRLNNVNPADTLSPRVHILLCTSLCCTPLPIWIITLHFVISSNNYNLTACLWLLSGCILECSGNVVEKNPDSGPSRTLGYAHLQ